MKNKNDVSYRSLFSSIAKGDEAAFSTLYEIFYPDLIRYVSTKVTEIALAEDILHDLFLSLWEGRARLETISAPSVYLYTACRYLIIDYIRKSSKMDAEAEVDEQINDRSAPLEDRLHYRYLLDIVNHEIENLPEKCREIFVLSREKYMSNAEIASKLGIAESTVENQINKALRRIRLVRKKYMMLLTILG